MDDRDEERARALARSLLAPYRAAANVAGLHLTSRPAELGTVRYAVEQAGAQAFERVASMFSTKGSEADEGPSLADVVGGEPPPLPPEPMPPSPPVPPASARPEENWIWNTVDLVFNFGTGKPLPPALLLHRLYEIVMQNKPDEAEAEQEKVQDDSAKADEKRPLFYEFRPWIALLISAAIEVAISDDAWDEGLISPFAQGVVEKIGRLPSFEAIKKSVSEACQTVFTKLSISKKQFFKSFVAVLTLPEGRAREAVTQMTAMAGTQKTELLSAIKTVAKRALKSITQPLAETIAQQVIDKIEEQRQTLYDQANEFLQESSASTFDPQGEPPPLAAEGGGTREAGAREAEDALAKAERKEKGDAPPPPASDAKRVAQSDRVAVPAAVNDIPSMQQIQDQMKRFRV